MASLFPHFSLFDTDLPPSEGKTVILVIDQFSKIKFLLPLLKMSSAKEMAEAALSYVSRLHGLLQGVVSDWGTQFASHFWKEFSKLSLSFDFCP